MSNALKLAQASFDAYVNKDRAAIEVLIADDFHFTSPLDNRIDRKTYFERCWPNSQNLKAFEFLTLASAEDQAVVTYEAVTNNGRHFRNTEVFTVRGDKIVAVDVYFGWSIPHEAPKGGFKDA